MAETRTITLVEFLEARLAEDEAPASRVERAAWPVGRGADFAGPHEDEEYATLHIGAGRVLREVEAKRAILADYRLAHSGARVLQHLAAVYADHPDYRDEFKP